MKHKKEVKFFKRNSSVTFCFNKKLTYLAAALQRKTKQISSQFITSVYCIVQLLVFASCSVCEEFPQQTYFLHA